MLTPRKKPVSGDVKVVPPVEAGLVVFDAEGIEGSAPRELLNA